MPVCLGNVIFLSLLIINTSMAARQIRTRVIGGYGSTREGALGAKCLFYFILPIFVLMENISCMSFLGEIHVVL
jgi:hypothetical protein